MKKDAGIYHLGEAAQREHDSGELFLRQAGQEVSLVFYSIRSHVQGDRFVLMQPPHKPCIVPRGNPVKLALVIGLQMIQKGSKLHPAVVCRV